MASSEQRLIDLEVRMSEQRLEVRDLSNQITALGERLGDKIDGVRSELSGRIGSLDQKLDRRVDTLDQKVDRVMAFQVAMLLAIVGALAAAVLSP
jgi:uncharacterized coiled-coil protein SlyX